MVSSRVYVDWRKIYWRRLLISFNHGNNVIQSNNKHFFFVWHYCLRLHPLEAECLREYVTMPMPLVIPVTLWHVNMSLYKTVKDLSAVAVKGDIVSKIFQIQLIFGYKFLFTGSNVSQRWNGWTLSVGYNSLLAFNLFTCNGKLFLSFQICPIGIIYLQFILLF